MQFTRLHSWERVKAFTESETNIHLKKWVKRSFNFQLSAVLTSIRIWPSGEDALMEVDGLVLLAFREGASLDTDEAGPCLAPSTQHNFDAVASSTTAQRKSTVSPNKVNATPPWQKYAIYKGEVRYQCHHGKAGQCCTATWSCVFASQTAAPNSAGRGAVREKYARLRKA